MSLARSAAAVPGCVAVALPLRLALPARAPDGRRSSATQPLRRRSQRHLQAERTGISATAAQQLQPHQQQPAAHNLPPAVAAFLEAFSSRRSVDGMVACLSDDATYLNLSLAPQPFVGHQTVAGVLADLVRSAPPEWRLVLDDAVSGGDTEGGAAASVVYHIEDGAGRPVPLSQGVAFYRLDQAGRICRITEASEQAVKLPQATLPALGAAVPLLQALGQLGGLAAGGVAPAVAPQPAQVRYAVAASSTGAAGQWAANLPSSSGRASSSSSSSSRAGRGRSNVAAASMPPASSSSSSSGGGSSIDGLAGTWIKDAGASDSASYARACDLMQLSGLQKMTAMQLIEGLEVEQRGGEVAVRFLTVVPFFKVTEVYVLGKAASLPRRDLQRGTQQAAASVAPDGSLQVDISWAAPNAGGVSEHYRLLEGGAALECQSTVSVAAGTETTRTVYRRSDSGTWQPRFQWNPLYALMRGGGGQQ